MANRPFLAEVTIMSIGIVREESSKGLGFELP